MPSTFGGIREGYEAGRVGVFVAPTLNGIRSGNDAQVAGSANSTTSGPHGKTGPSPIRGQVQQAHNQLNGKTQGAIGDFDAKAQIVKTPDGTLKSKKSLFVQTGKQAAGDADLTLNAAKDAVKNLLGRNQ